MKPESINLACQDSKSDKVYDVFLKKDENGWYVNVQYGRRGKELTRDGKGDELDYASAKAIYDGIKADKIKKGYYDVNCKPLAYVPPAIVGSRIYGASDDLIEVESGIKKGEYGWYGSDDAATGALLACSDGTLLDVKYGKNDGAIWEVKLIRKGNLFDRIDQCDNEEDKIYSDIAYFKGYLSWVYAAKEWEKVH